MIEDAILLRRLRRGSKDALELIYQKYESLLLTLAANLTGDPAIAEDVVQDVFVSLARSPERFGAAGNLKAYLATCTANRARDYLRAKHSRQAGPLDEAGQLPSNTSGPAELAVQNELMFRLREAVAELPHEQREAVILRLQADMKFRHIAKLQSVSVRTALSRYRYGLDKLRSILNGEVQK